MEKYTKMPKIKHCEHTNELLNLLEVSTSGISCKIYPNLGASIQELTWNGIEIIKGIEHSEKGLEAYHIQYSSSPLFPFPGRIENGSYSFQGETYTLEQNEINSNNAIHGLVAFEAFELSSISETKNSVALEFLLSKKKAATGFPFDFDLTIHYHFSSASFSISFEVLNTGTRSFPFGLGWHPYFKSSDLSGSSLSFDASHKTICSSNMIPIEAEVLKTPTSFVIDSLELDTCYTLSTPQLRFTTRDYQLTMDLKKNTEKNYIQIYTPAMRDCIAIEPMTCIPNAFNRPNEAFALLPGARHTFTINLTLDSHE